ncbi:MAG TPA: hypothetical protein VGR56_06275 [Nitrososphaerales archaeon]|nr:hypothetical protein [Nitrososphaerales archaeon]
MTEAPLLVGIGTTHRTRVNDRNATERTFLFDVVMRIPLRLAKPPEGVMINRLVVPVNFSFEKSGDCLEYLVVL